MHVIRNWRQAVPQVDHGFAIIWPIFPATRRSRGVSHEEGLLEGMAGFPIYRIQAGQSGGYHRHKDREQAACFIKDQEKMKLVHQVHPV